MPRGQNERAYEKEFQESGVGIQKLEFRIQQSEEEFKIADSKFKTEG
jgi:hypothetical protein